MLYGNYKQIQYMVDFYSLSYEYLCNKMGLKAKIIFGYSILIALLIVTIYMFRKEQINRNILHMNEKELVHTWQLTEEIYTDLLELTTEGEMVSVWKEEDYLSYTEKRKRICDTLQVLKKDAYILGLQSRIDTLCLLLEKKEKMLYWVMNTFNKLKNSTDIIGKRIPTIISHIKNAPLSSGNNQETTSEKKKNIWSFFRRKEKQSAYLKQKEEKEKTKNTSNITAGMLYSLNNEVADKQNKQQRALSIQMDSLYTNNQILNRKLNNLVRELELETNRRISNRYRELVVERENSYSVISKLAIFITLIAILLYIIIHRELNRKYRYEKELEASDRRNRELLQSRKDMMLSIAHDLRSPLSTIKGAAELLPEESVPERRHEYMESISHASDYMLTLVETLMNFYLLDTEQSRSQISVYNLESLFKEVADNFLLQARKKDLRFSSEFLDMDTVVSGDRGQLQQIINNLMANALKFTEKGSICLRAEYHGGELRFSVQDTGCGMDRKDTERIFTAFERLENARNVPGFGLGLTISYRLVSRMGGNIRVESRRGEGSTFIVILPLRQADEKSPIEESKPVSVISRLNGISVLLLDDDIRQLRITGEMLKRLGADCTLCTTSRELIARIREKSYDVLLTDIQMPEMDGFSILELLRSSNIDCANTIPVIALTARVDDDVNYLSCGFAGCIRKPFSIDKLFAGISGIIGTVKERIWKPDLSLLFAGEDNHEEMLRIFVDESRKELSRLHDALHRNDRQALREILHKNLPLWETVHLDYPMEMLHEIVTTNPEEWQDKHLKEIYRIEQAASKLIIHVEKMQEETHEKNNTYN